RSLLSTLRLATALARLAAPPVSTAQPGPTPNPRPRGVLAAAAEAAAVAPVALHSKLPAPAAAVAGADLELVKRALEVVRRGRSAEVGPLQASIHDPTAWKLVEWAILRSDETNAGLDRYMASISANPGW